MSEKIYLYPSIFCERPTSYKKRSDGYMFYTAIKNMTLLNAAHEQRTHVHTREEIMFYYRIRRKTTDYDEHLEQLFPSYYN